MNIAIPAKLYDYLVNARPSIWNEIMTWGYVHRSRRFKVYLSPYASFEVRTKAEELERKLKKLYRSLK
ncbi:hypothetical protein G20c_56 [Thermus phage G20c]|nr:hypothetical protein G20c_56 [Thermus phage G20c]